MRDILLITLTVTACHGCTKTAEPARDAAADLSPADAAPTQPTPAVSLTVDFTVEGCPSIDSQTPSCAGTVPLTLRFVPLATTTVTKYIWDFGDLTLSNAESAPSHTYSVPGNFTVTVVAAGVGGGVVSKTHAHFVDAQPNTMGSPCDSNPQCGDGLYCLCPASAACPTGPALGMCTSSCQVGTCGDAQVCAGLLTATPPPGAAAPWQTSLCLLGCAGDQDCSTGLRCRTLPPGPSGSAWVHGCFADVPKDIGDPCTDAAGTLRNDLCASGFCAVLGAKGLCSMNCAVASCPPGSDCAVLGDGRKLCLRPCAGAFTCAQDPLLTCVVSGPGDLGYHLVNPAGANATSSYCVPKPCVSDAPCTPTGTCAAETGNGHCVARSN